MSKASYFQPLIETIENRSVESTVSMLGIKDKYLRAHLVKELKDKASGSAFLADTVFESMFPWTPDEMRMHQLAGDGKLLNEKLVKAMDEAGDHQFGKDWFPFKHQVTAWNTLLEDKKSAIVTSGTGSGKTECFMVPILNDLVNEYEQTGEDLVGVRALFIYPLNALINSQRERLRAWTEAFDSGIRFCLYNGNTKENKHHEQSKYPNEILTRKELRKEPSPIMVTNATMLEYMLVRQNDAPIIQQSKGKLRWIVLDEAHTYIGSQAAELSLLLRRVLHTFGVEAKDVRFVATSATIGDKDAEAKLQEYLANLAGIGTDQVVVVGGKRFIPSIDGYGSSNTPIEEILNTEPDNTFSSKRYEMLTSHPIACKLRANLVDENDLHPKLSQLTKAVLGEKGDEHDLLRWLDIASHTVLPGPIAKKPDIDSTPFLPVRAHLFHQVMSGLWACCDKNCSEKEKSDLCGYWPFGQVYSKRKQSCGCGAPIFELVFCQDCNEPHLMASVDSKGNYQQYNRDSLDEFSLDYEYEEEDELDEDSEIIGRVYFSPIEDKDLTDLVSLSRDDYSRTGLGADTLDLNEMSGDQNSCVCCGYMRKPTPFRQSLLGTPFYISNTVPMLLEACQDGDNPNEQPSRGRRLITFTDSRQGTARIATKVQQDSERDSVRGIVYKTTTSNKSSIPESELSGYTSKIDNYDQIIKSLEDNNTPDELIEQTRIHRQGVLEKMSQLSEDTPILWNDLVSRLQSAPDIETWGLDYYQRLNPELFPDTGGARTLAEMFLLREFARRPKRANSLETLGLVALCYPALDNVKTIPSEWKKLNYDENDWKDFLKVMLDYYVRENTILDIPSDWVNWMGAKVYPKSVIRFDATDPVSARIKKWPQVTGARSNRMVRILVESSNININEPTSKDMVNRILQAAWHVLASNETGILKPLPSAGTSSFQLDRTAIAFKTINEAWVCPITHRILDTTFCGISPYLPFNIGKTNVNCKKVNVDSLEVDDATFSSNEEKKAFVRDWIASNDNVKALRDENLWTDVSDRILEGGSFYRAVEHSAQQPASKLSEYEALFKTGKINVMSCSTTMEMGVDIGGISVVAMNNVPPHPANYLQRAGRAGRRGETQALSFTICKDNPHERSVFRNPQWPFKTAIPAPYITFNSQQIVQRHINSLLLSYFLHNVYQLGESESAIKLDCAWFFIPEEDKESNFEKYCLWLMEIVVAGLPEYLTVGIEAIKKGSVLANYSNQVSIEQSLEGIETVAEKWMPPYQELKKELDKLKTVSEKDPYKRKVEHDLKRIGGDYLLSELASNAYLPGYGFPTGIATFDHYSIHDYKQKKYLKVKGGRIDNLSRMKERPGRDLPVAIREYAPGSGVVIDGLSYRSAGILLNQYEPDGGFNQPVNMRVEWRCSQCGEIGQTTGSNFDNRCTSCDAEIKAANRISFIEPLGFAVDFYSEPSTDVTHQTYVPVKEPWVTAGGELKGIFNPRLGAYKVNPAGHIFYHSGGEFDQGYAVCLRCGRAESMLPDGGYPKDLMPGKRHLRLQGKAGPEAEAMCEGSEETYAIQENIRLGASDQTDIFELYLKDTENDSYLPAHGNEILMWTLAVVLRQSLADIHGINAEELGFTVKEDNSDFFSQPAAVIALFDKCGGGAGFSSAAPTHMKVLLEQAARYLDCDDHCDSACQSCLMGYETRFHESKLNRYVAKEYLASMAKYLSMPEEAKVFDEDSHYCLETIDGELIRASNSGYEKLAIYISSFDEGACIAGSGIKERCLKYAEIFDNVALVIRKENASSLSEEQREDLWVLTKSGVDVCIGEVKNKSVLAQVSSGDDVRTFGSDNLEASIADDYFWELMGSHLIYSDAISVYEFDAASGLKPESKQGDVEIEITKQCDGSVLDFGDNLWEQILSKHPQVANKVSSGFEISEISYIDCYITSPISLILFSQLINGLKCQLANNWNNPTIKLRTSDKTPYKPSFGLYGEWGNKDDQATAYENYFAKMEESLDVKFFNIKELPHARTLSIFWADGSKSKVRLDHGVGYWIISGKGPYFSFDEYPEQQVTQMYSSLRDLKVVQGKKFPTLLFVKHSES